VQAKPNPLARHPQRPRIGLPRSPSLIQCLGKNIDLVAEEDRFFEVTDGSERLRVNPDSDAYLEAHFNEATRVGQTDLDLTDKLIYLLHYYKFQIPYNKIKKIEAFDSNVQPLDTGGSQKVRNLGTMLHASAATCWEKAALFHLSLAEIGISSMLEGGYNKTTGTGHAWVILDNGVVIDPTSKRISRRTVYTEKYNITVTAKKVASPKVAVSSSALRSALQEVYRYVGNFLEEVTVKRVELRVEQQKKNEERERESREFNKLLTLF
jgi:hypothetical protein